MDRIHRINKIKPHIRSSFLFLFDLILYIPFPRLRGKVGWGRLV
jgi:hypothetical protein